MQELISLYSVMGCNMSLKLFFWHPPYGSPPPPENMGAISDEHGERFHHIFLKLERGIVENGVQIHWLTAA